MEIIGGILAGIAITFILAAIGITTVAALALMGILGLTTEMSFKRLFFVSFGLGLFAPLLTGLAISSAFEDPAFQQELRQELGDTLPGGVTFVGDLEEAVPRFQELRDQLRSGEIDGEEFERRLEALIEETSGARIDLDVRDGIEAGEGLTITTE